MALPKTEEDRRLLASILMHEEEQLTPETVEGAVRALRRISLGAAGGSAAGSGAPGAPAGGKTGAFAGKSAPEAGPDGPGRANEPASRHRGRCWTPAGLKLGTKSAAPARTSAAKELAGKRYGRQRPIGNEGALRFALAGAPIRRAILLKSVRLAHNSVTTSHR